MRGRLHAWVRWNDEYACEGVGRRGDLGDRGDVGGGGWEVEIHLGVDADKSFGKTWKGHCAIGIRYELHLWCAGESDGECMGCLSVSYIVDLMEGSGLQLADWRTL